MTPDIEPTPPTPALRLRSLTGRYGATTAVDHIDLDVHPGEFVTMLGPSGSGKTTVLRMIAGFLEPASGRIELAGRDITTMPPYERDIGVVFQNYALFPHMTAGQNVLFPLQMREMSKAEAARRVDDALRLVRLDGLQDRYPRQLSGGQQQRVALARALVFEPRILLMDEPLAALDKKLREQLQSEIRRIHQTLGVTVVYVTHDQEEALVLSDRIAVFRSGGIEQIGPAREIYERPLSLFVAGFIGEANVLAGAYSGSVDRPSVETAVGTLRVLARDHEPGRSAALVIRPERLRLCTIGSRPDDDENQLRGVVLDVTYLGSSVKYAVDVGGTTLVAKSNDGDGDRTWETGANVAATWRITDGVLVADPNPHDQEAPERGVDHV